MANKGLYYYKLVSEYPEDITKQCKLTINEIDSNFKTLKDEDIKSAELDEENYAVVLTRNDGDKYIVDLSPILSGAVYDLKIEYNNQSGTTSGASVYVTYSVLDEKDEKVGVSVPIEGLITTSNIDEIHGQKFKVYTDGTLTGNGNLYSPLSVSKLWLDTPAIKVIDRIEGEELPEEPSFGDKYVTKELVNDYGMLYNYKAVKEISDKLNEDGGIWRVPTKNDWDCLLNSIEPCDCVVDGTCSHSKPDCHVELGKYAGRRLKSKCGWQGQEKCECKNTVPFSDNFCDSGSTGDTSTTEESTNVADNVPYSACVGTDEFGMRILPSGYKDEYDVEVKQIEKSTAFWTSSYVCDSGIQDIYVKKFNFDRCGVIQEAQCPDDFYSLRLVKDYDGENYLESETIDGITYETVLMPECKQIWISTNFASECSGNCVPGGDDSLSRVVYFVNVWNGKVWEKRPLNEGESITVMEGNEFCQYNIDYRVFLESDENNCNNQVLINSDDAVTERVIHAIVPLIEEEKEERIAADEALAEAIEDETNRAISAETALDEKIDAETERAISAETALDEKIDAETERAISAETALDEKIDAETERAISAETALDEKIDAETERAISAETALDEKIDEEEARAKAREDEIDGQLIDASKNPYILYVNSGEDDNLVFESKDGNPDHFIRLKINSDFGTF